MLYLRLVVHTYIEAHLWRLTSESAVISLILLILDGQCAVCKLVIMQFVPSNNLFLAFDSLGSADFSLFAATILKSQCLNILV